MAPYYRVVTSSSGIDVDPTLLETMEKANEEQLKKLDECLADAKKMEGDDSEISDALKERVNHLTQIGDKDAAVAAQQPIQTRVKVMSILDLRPGIFSDASLFFGDNTLITENLAKAEKLIKEGGDWDRQNCLKVYRSVHLVSIPQFKPGRELLLDAQLISYNDFIAVTVIVNMLTLARVDLKKKVRTFISILPELPVLDDYLHSLYDCHYAKLFVALAMLEQTYLLPSRLLSPHMRYYIHEILGGMFGMSINSIDRELSRFIANGHLHCMIDKVHGVVEMTRPSSKMAQYEKVVKQGA
ncbi:26S proteasome subunit RPN7-domain-containing protein, partial [Pisolithus microcarpus]